METSMTEIRVKKRNGRGDEDLKLEKIHRMVEFACEGLAGVSESQIEMNANIQFYDGITTDDIQEILIRSANDLISLDNPNYQFVAARLLCYALRKGVYGDHPDYRPFIVDHVENCIEKGVYDETILDAYSREEWNTIDSYIDNDRDNLYTYAGLRQVVDKYLVQAVSYTHLTLPTSDLV